MGNDSGTWPRPASPSRTNPTAPSIVASRWTSMKKKPSGIKPKPAFWMKRRCRVRNRRLRRRVAGQRLVRLW